MPQYMLLAYESEADFEKRGDPKRFEPYMGGWMAYSQAMNDVTSAGAALQGPETATTVRVRGGKREVQDGPYADAKEQLGGYFVIDAPDLSGALDWAAKCPAAADGRVEVRAVMATPGEE